MQGMRSSNGVMGGGENVSVPLFFFFFWFFGSCLVGWEVRFGEYRGGEVWGWVRWEVEGELRFYMCAVCVCVRESGWERKLPDEKAINKELS